MKLPTTTRQRRLNLYLPDETYRLMKDTRDKTGAASISEIVRRAVTLYGHVCANKGKLRIVTDEGEIQILVV